MQILVNTGIVQAIHSDNAYVSDGMLRVAHVDNLTAAALHPDCVLKIIPDGWQWPVPQPDGHTALQVGDPDPCTGNPSIEITAEGVLTNVVGVNGLSTLTYAQMDTYIANNITDLASAKTFIKKMARILLFLLKKLDLRNAQ
jgi:hypothetical protein